MGATGALKIPSWGERDFVRTSNCKTGIAGAGQRVYEIQWNHHWCRHIGGACLGIDVVRRHCPVGNGRGSLFPDTATYFCCRSWLGFERRACCRRRRHHCGRHFAAPMAALLMALTSYVPAAIGAYLSGLARPASELGGPEGIMVWYPLSDIVFRLALMVAASFIIIGFILGFGPDMARELANTLINRLAEADPQFTASDEMRQSVSALLMVALPAIQPATCLAILVGNLYLALRLTALSGRLRRPRDDWPATMRMPRPALLVLRSHSRLHFAGRRRSHCYRRGGRAEFRLHDRRPCDFSSAYPWQAMASRRPLADLRCDHPLRIPAFRLHGFGLFDTSRGAPISKIPEADNQ